MKKAQKEPPSPTPRDFNTVMYVGCRIIRKKKEILTSKGGRDRATGRKGKGKESRKGDGEECQGEK